MSEAMQFPGMDQQQPQKPSLADSIGKKMSEGISGFFGNMFGLRNEAKNNMTPDAPKPSNPFLGNIMGKLQAFGSRINSFWK
jgi:hypothetical protein